MPNSDPEPRESILAAVQLGWLTVETFGRLRRYAHARRRSSSGESDATRRFNFSDRDLSLTDQLLIALQRTKAVSNLLVPDLPPPIPDDPKEWLGEAVNDLDALWGEFEDWSREVWNHLQVQDPLSGRAFTYGGSLADTYWHADGSGADQLSGLLRSQRLEHIAARFDSIAVYLPPRSVEVIHHTLYRWRFADKFSRMDEEGMERVLQRLEAQSKVWQDVLFDLQRAESYLRGDDRRKITWGAFGSIALLVIMVSVVVWLGVLFLAGAGRTLLASTSGVTDQLTIESGQIAEKLLDYQNWSSMLATLSSVVVVLTGFISQLSGWMINFHNRIYAWLKLRRVYKRTYRRWDK